MIVSLFLLAASQGNASALPSDARLDRAVAMESRIEPLPELLATLGKGTGATLTVERKMMPLKATVLVAARPVRRTMEELASVFDAQWVLVEGGYRLEMSIPKRNLLERYIEAERKDHFAGTEALWRERAAYAEVPWPQIATARDESMSAVGRFTSSNDPGFAAASARFQALDAMARGGHYYLIGRLLGTLTKRDWTELWQGRAFYASSVAKAGAVALPPDSMDIVSPMRSHQAGEKDPPVRVFFRIDPDAGDAQWVAMWDGGATSGKGSNGERDSDLSNHPFRKALDAWATDAETGKAPELDRPLKPVDAVPSPWQSPWANESDTLAEFHRQSGLDIVAEASRRASRRAPGPLTEPTVRAALAEWSIRGTARLENGTMLYRPYQYWSRRSAEPPEAALRSWEARPDAGLDALADLAAALTPAQAQLIGSMTARKRMERLAPAFSILRVWGKLSAAERARLRAGTPLPLGAMSLPAREAALAAMLNGIFEGASLSSRMLTLFDAPWDLAALGAISLYVRTTYPNSKQEVETGSWWLDAPSGTDEKISKLSPGPGIQLEFGPAPGEGLSFTVPR